MRHQTLRPWPKPLVNLKEMKGSTMKLVLALAFVRLSLLEKQAKNKKQFSKAA